jgi:hypothetical protein
MLILAYAGAAQAFPKPRPAMTLGFDTSTLVLKDEFIRNADLRMHDAPTVGAALIWPVARVAEFEIGAQYGEVGRQTRVAYPTAYDPFAESHSVKVDDVLRTIDLPLRVRFVAPDRAWWLFEMGVVASARIDASEHWGKVESTPLAMARGASRMGANATIFEGQAYSFDVTDAYRPWHVRAALGLGHRWRWSGRSVDTVVRWEEGLTDLIEAGFDYQLHHRARVIRLALSLH